MGKVKDHIIKMYENPKKHSFWEISKCSGYSWFFIVKQAITSFIDWPSQGWTYHANSAKVISLEQDW